MVSVLLTDVGLRPLAISLTATSFILFGTGMLELVGPIPIIRNKLGPVNLSPKDRVKVFGAFFRRIAPFIVGGTLTSAISSLYAAYVTSNPNIKQYSYISAIGIFSIIPYTMLVLQPTNHTLLGFEARALKGEELTPAEEGRVSELIEKWATLHPVRFIGYGIGWVGALLAFTAGVAKF